MEDRYQNEVDENLRSQLELQTKTAQTKRKIELQKRQAALQVLEQEERDNASREAGNTNAHDTNNPNGQPGRQLILEIEQMVIGQHDPRAQQQNEEMVDGNNTESAHEPEKLRMLLLLLFLILLFLFLLL